MIENVIIGGFSVFYISLVLSRTDALTEWREILLKIVTGRVTLGDFSLFFSKLIHCGICSSFHLAFVSSLFIGFIYIFAIAGISSFLWIISAYLLDKMYS